MGKIANTVKKASRPIRVIRRATAVRGGDGRLTPGAETVAIVRMVVQPVTGRALERKLSGDNTVGDVAVWAIKANLAKAYAEGDADKVPLGWTELNIAPAKGAEGPRGDYFEWSGRTYEITRFGDWSQDGLIPDADLHTYAANERGGA